MSINIFTVVGNGQGKLDIQPLDMTKFTKVHEIKDAKSYTNGLPSILPQVFAMAKGDADIAVCVRNDGIHIPIVVPKGQRLIANF